MSLPDQLDQAVRIALSLGAGLTTVRTLPVGYRAVHFRVPTELPASEWARATEQTVHYFRERQAAAGRVALNLTLEDTGRDLVLQVYL